MDSLSDWDANTPYQEERPINIHLLQMKRANKAALAKGLLPWSIGQSGFCVV